MKGQNCIRKTTLKRFILRRGKSKLQMCISYPNRNYCCPNSHPQNLFVQWKKSPSTACGSPQDVVSTLHISDGCQWAGMGMLTLGWGLPWDGRTHPTAPASSRAAGGHQGSPNPRHLPEDGTGAHRWAQLCGACSHARLRGAGDQPCCSITGADRGLTLDLGQRQPGPWPPLGPRQRPLLPARSTLTPCRGLDSAKAQPGSTQDRQS